MEPDRGLVEHVQDPDQSRPDLGRQPDPLALPTRQRRRLPVEGEILEPDLGHEPEPGADLLEDLLGDRALALVEVGLKILEVCQRVADRQLVDLGDGGAVDQHGSGFGFQPGALAGWTGRGRHVLLDVFAGAVAVGLDVTTLQVRDHTLETLAFLAGAVFRLPAKLHHVVGPVEKLPANVCGQLLEGGLQTDAEVLGDVVELARVVGPVVTPGLEDVFQRLGGVLYDKILADLLGLAEPLTLRAGAVGTVKRERSGLDRADVDPAVRAGKFLGELDDQPIVLLVVAEIARRADARPAQLQVGGGIGNDHLQYPVGFLESGLDGVGDPPPGVLGEPNPIDHHVDRVVVVLVEFGPIEAQVVALPVDLDTGVPLRGQLVEQLLEGAFLIAHDRCTQLRPSALRGGEQPPNHLLRALFGDLAATLRAVWRPDPGVQQAQVVVQLRDGADRRPGVVGGVFLIDRDRRREPLDGLDLGFVHLSEEVPGVGRQ